MTHFNLWFIQWICIASMIFLVVTSNPIHSRTKRDTNSTNSISQDQGSRLEHIRICHRLWLCQEKKLGKRACKYVLRKYREDPNKVRRDCTEVFRNLRSRNKISSNNSD